MNDHYGTQRTEWEEFRRRQVIDNLMNINNNNIRFYSPIEGTVIESLYRTCIILNYYGKEIRLSWNLIDRDFSRNAFMKLHYNGRIYILPSSENFYNNIRNACNVLL
jgi:hypothetical protein